MLQHYIEHRQQVHHAAAPSSSLSKARARAHILEGLGSRSITSTRSSAPSANSRTAESARDNLMTNFKLSEIQANAILDMQLRRLAALERKKIEDEYEEL